MQIKKVCWFSIGKGGGYCGGKWSGGFGRQSLNNDAKTEALKMIGQILNLYKCHSPRMSFN